MSRRRGLWLLLGVYLVLLFWLTLTPQDDGTASGLLWRLSEVLMSWPPTAWAEFLVLEFLANIALFVPFGVLVTVLLGRRRWWWAVVAAVALTVGIETVQYFLPTRVTDMRDEIANTLGGALGAWGVFALTARAVRPTAGQPSGV